jgi:hypothetical protein
MNDAHAREVAVIEAMVGSFFEPVERDRSIAQLIAGRISRFSNPVSKDRLWWASQEQWWGSQAQQDFAIYGTVLVGHQWNMVGFDEAAEIPEPSLPRAAKPQRVMGRPRKVAQEPGRKFSGMSRFPWRQQ